MRKCLTTDATKNTVNAFAKEHGEAARQPESFGVALAKHFVDDIEPVRPGSDQDRGLPVEPAEPQRHVRIRMRSPGTAATSARQP